MNWISVDKAYPENEWEDYLVYHDDGTITIEPFIISYDGIRYFGNMSYNIIAWMPLPQYIGEEEA